MKKQLIVMGLLVAALMTTMAPVADAAKANVKTKDACKSGGWMGLIDANGVPFTSEKACKDFAKAGGTPTAVFAIAYGDLDGRPGFDPTPDAPLAPWDQLISMLVDGNGDGVLNSGDSIILDVYPRSFAPTDTSDFSDFGLRDIPVDAMTAGDANAFVTVRDSSGYTHTWTSDGESQAYQTEGVLIRDVTVPDPACACVDEVATVLTAPDYPLVRTNVQEDNPGDATGIEVDVN